MAAKNPPRKVNLSENIRLDEEMDRMRKERDDMLYDARQLTSNMTKLEQDFGDGVDFGRSPEEIVKMLGKFEQNAEKTFIALDGVNDDFSKILSEQIELEEALLVEDHSVLAMPVRLEQELKDRKIASNAKLNDIFLKLKKQHNDMIHSLAHDIDQDIGGEGTMDSESTLVPILQRKCNQLKKEEMHLMAQKLVAMESRQRFAEQMGRDESGMAGSVSRVEYEELQRECVALKEKLDASEAESNARNARIQQLQRDLLSVQGMNHELENAKSRMLHKQEELNRKHAYSADRVREGEEEMERRLQIQHVEFEEVVRESKGRLEVAERELAVLMDQNEDLLHTKGTMEKTLRQLEEDNRRMKESLSFSEQQLRRQSLDHVEALKSSKEELQHAEILAAMVEQKMKELERVLQKNNSGSGGSNLGDNSSSKENATSTSPITSTSTGSALPSGGGEKVEQRYSTIENRFKGFIKKIQTRIQEVPVPAPLIVVERVASPPPVIAQSVCDEDQEEKPECVDVAVQCSDLFEDRDLRPNSRRASFDDDDGMMMRQGGGRGWTGSGGGRPFTPLSDKHLVDMMGHDDDDAARDVRSEVDDNDNDSNSHSDELFLDAVVTFAETCSQTEVQQLLLDCPLELTELRTHPLPPVSAPVHLWTPAQKRLHLGESVCLGPPGGMEPPVVVHSILSVHETVHTNSFREVAPVIQTAVVKVEEEVVRPKVIMNSAVIQTDMTCADIIELRDRLREKESAHAKLAADHNALLEETGALREAAKDWTSDSKWTKIAQSEEGRKYIAGRLEAVIERAVELIVADENVTLKDEGLRGEQKERMQARQAMLLKLKAVQAVQSLLPEDFLTLDQQFVGIKLEYPEELLPYLRSLEDHAGEAEDVAVPEMTMSATVVVPAPVVKSAATHEAVMNKMKMKQGSDNRIMRHGEVRRENFERLKDKGFGADNLIDLTVLHYHARSIEDEDGHHSVGMGMQHRALIMERDALRRRIVTDVTIEDMYRALYASERHYIMLATLDAWQRLVHFSNGGQFKDVLSAHIESLKVCVEGAGGTEVAMQRLVQRQDFEEDTSFWPEPFRIKVLEYFRTEILRNKKGSENEKEELLNQLAVCKERQRDMALQAEAAVPAPTSIHESLPTTGMALLRQKSIRKQEAVAKGFVHPSPRSTSMSMSSDKQTTHLLSPATATGTNTFGGSVSLAVNSPPVSVTSFDKTGLAQIDETLIGSNTSTPTQLQPLVLLKNEDTKQPENQPVVDLMRYSLHRPADRITLGIFQGNDHALGMAEGLVQFLGYWNDHMYPEATAVLKQIQETCSAIPEEVNFLSNLQEVLLATEQSRLIPIEVNEIFAKFNDVLELRERLEEEALIAKDKRPGMERVDSVLTIQHQESSEHTGYGGRVSNGRSMKGGKAPLGRAPSARMGLNKSGPSFRGGNFGPNTNTLSSTTGTAAASSKSGGGSFIASTNTNTNTNPGGSVRSGSHGPPAPGTSSFSDVVTSARLAAAVHNHLEDRGRGGIRTPTSPSPLYTGNTHPPPSVSQFGPGSPVGENLTPSVSVNGIGSPLLSSSRNNNGNIAIGALDSSGMKSPPSPRWKNRVLERQQNRRSREKKKEEEVAKEEAKKPILRAAPTAEASTQTVFDVVIPMTLMDDNNNDNNNNIHIRSMSADVRDDVNFFDREDSIMSRASTGYFNSLDSIADDGGGGDKKDVMTEKDPKSVFPDVLQSLSTLDTTASAPSTMAITTDARVSPVLISLPKSSGKPSRRSSKLVTSTSSLSSKSQIKPRKPVDIPVTNALSRCPTLLPPFRLVYLSDSFGELELCPGVFLATKYSLPPPPSPPVPRGIWLIRRVDDAPLLHEIEEAPCLDRVMPGPLPDPLPEGLIAAWLPPVIPLGPGLDFVPGADFGPNLELPKGFIVVRVYEGATLLSGMEFVELSQQYSLPANFTTPPGLILVQMKTTVTASSLAVEGGIELAPGVEAAETPPDSLLVLPPGVMYITTRDERAELPEYLEPILPNGADDMMEKQLYMSGCCKILRRPPGLDLPLGMELISRPPDVPLPFGMSLAPPSRWPPGVTCPMGMELVQLEPRFELPPGLVISPNVEVVARLPFMRLPRNVILVSRGLGAIVPPGFRPVPMPNLPHGVSHFPPGVEALEMTTSAHLQPGTELCPGIVVAEMAAGTARLPVGMEFVRRQQWAECPSGMERCLRNDLPPKTRLPPGVEVVRFVPRFEVPPGVGLGRGARLGRNVQLSPGTVLGKGMEVVEWPYGIYLPSHVDLVRLPASCNHQVPLPFHRFDYDLPRGTLLPPGCVPVQLPDSLKLPSARQLGELIQVVEYPPEWGAEKIPSGTVLIKQKTDEAIGCLPAEMIPLSHSELPVDLKLPRNVLAVRLAPRMEVPVGVELAMGVEVVSPPIGLYLPRNLVLVKISQGSTLPHGVEKYPLHIPKHLPPLPEDVFPVTIPSDIKVHSWGWKLAVGMIVDSTGTDLPPGAQLVQTKGDRELPAGLRLASHSDLPLNTVFPQGVSVIFLPETFALPPCVGIHSMSVLSPSTLLSPHEVLCLGATVAPRPHGLILPPGVDIVQLTPGADLRSGMTVMDAESSQAILEPSNATLPPGYVLLRIEGSLPAPRDRLHKPKNDSVWSQGARRRVGVGVGGNNMVEVNLVMRLQSNVPVMSKSIVTDDELTSPSAKDKDSKSQRKDKETLERSNAVLRREMRDQQKKLERVTNLLEDMKKRTLVAEESARKSESESRNIRTDLDICKSQSVHAESSLKKRLVDMEANKNRMITRIKEMQSQIDGLNAQVQMWKSVDQEVSQDVIAEAEKRGRMETVADIAAARKQTFLETKKVLEVVVRHLCEVIGSALTYSGEAGGDEIKKQCEMLSRYRGADVDDLSSIGGISIKRKRGRGGGGPSSSAEESSDNVPQGGGPMSGSDMRHLSPPRDGTPIVAMPNTNTITGGPNMGHKKSVEVDVVTGLGVEVIDPTLYTIGQIKGPSSSVQVTVDNSAVTKPNTVANGRMVPEVDSDWDPILVHLTHLSGVRRPRYDAEKEFSKLMSKIEKSFSFNVKTNEEVYSIALSADVVAAEGTVVTWVQTNVKLLHGYIDTILAKYLEAIRLADVEVHAQIIARKAYARKNLLLSKMMHVEQQRDPLDNDNDHHDNGVGGGVSGVSGGSKDSNVLFLHARLDELRLQGQKPVLDLLKEQARRMQDLHEVHNRLLLCAMVLKKRALEEETSVTKRTFTATDHLAKGDVGYGGRVEAESRASQFLCKRLIKQSNALVERAELVQSEVKQLRVCMQEELSDFQCAVQQVLPAQVLAKLLQWGNTRHQTAAMMPSLPVSLRDGYLDVNNNVNVNGIPALDLVSHFNSNSNSSDNPRVSGNTHIGGGRSTTGGEGLGLGLGLLSPHSVSSMKTSQSLPGQQSLIHSHKKPSNNNSRNPKLTEIATDSGSGSRPALTIGGLHGLDTMGVGVGATGRKQLDALPAYIRRPSGGGGAPMTVDVTRDSFSIKSLSASVGAVPRNRIATATATSQQNRGTNLPQKKEDIVFCDDDSCKHTILVIRKKLLSGNNLWARLLSWLYMCTSGLFEAINMSVGGNLLSRFHGSCFSDAGTIPTWVQSSIKTCDDCLLIIKARSNAEDLHSKNLSKISCMELVYSPGSLQDSMDQLRSDMNHKAIQHRILSANLMQDIYEPIAALRTQLTVRQKTLVSQYQTMQKDIRTLEDAYRKSWSRYERAYKEAHSYWAACKASGLAEPVLTPDMFRTESDVITSSSISPTSNSSKLPLLQRSSTHPVDKSPHSSVKSQHNNNNHQGGELGGGGGGGEDPPSVTPSPSVSSHRRSGSNGMAPPPPPPSLSSSGNLNFLSSALSPATFSAIANTTRNGKDLLNWALQSTVALTPLPLSSRQCTDHLISSSGSCSNGSSGAGNDLQGAAVHQLQSAERYRRKCEDHWNVLAKVTKKSALKLQMLLTKFQGMVETFLILIQDHLRKLVVFESSAIANQQYDLQMLFKVFENASPENDIRAFMEVQDTAYGPGDIPVLSDLITGVSHPDTLPLPPPPGLLACPVSPHIPTISREEQQQQLALPILLRSEQTDSDPDPVGQLPESQSQSHIQTENNDIDTNTKGNENDNKTTTESEIEVSLSKRRGGGGYAQAQDVLKALLELSTASKSKSSSSTGLNNTPPPPPDTLSPSPIVSPSVSPTLVVETLSLTMSEPSDTPTKESLLLLSPPLSPEDKDLLALREGEELELDVQERFNQTHTHQIHTNETTDAYTGIGTRTGTTNEGDGDGGGDGVESPLTGIALSDTTGRGRGSRPKNRIHPPSFDLDDVTTDAMVLALAEEDDPEENEEEVEAGSMAWVGPSGPGSAVREEESRLIRQALDNNWTLFGDREGAGAAAGIIRERERATSSASASASGSPWGHGTSVVDTFGTTVGVATHL
eukprot:gene1408-2706_t